MRSFIKPTLICAALIAAYSSVNVTQTISGSPRVIDGDTLDFGGKRVRLFGIDACEINQSFTKGRTTYHCGRHSKLLVSDIIGKRPVLCKTKSKDHYGRYIGRCYNYRRNDIASELLLLGGAIVYHPSGTSPDPQYAFQQQIAAGRGVGIWQIEDFQTPADYRRNRR